MRLNCLNKQKISASYDTDKQIRSWLNTEKEWGLRISFSLSNFNASKDVRRYFHLINCSQVSCKRKMVDGNRTFNAGQMCCNNSIRKPKRHIFQFSMLFYAFFARMQFRNALFVFHIILPMCLSPHMPVPFSQLTDLNLIWERIPWKTCKQVVLVSSQNIPPTTVSFCELHSEDKNAQCIIAAV